MIIEMHSGTINNRFLTLEKVHGTKARSGFGKGLDIFIQCQNLSPFDPRQQAEKLDPDMSFGSQVDAFEYFQCTTKETGYRPSFYIAVDENTVEEEDY